MKVRPDVGALPATGLTSEQGFDIGQPDVIGPSIGADRSRMAAMIVRAIDQETHFSEGNLLRARDGGHAA
jgi:hypothetical protein